MPTIKLGAAQLRKITEKRALKAGGSVKRHLLYIILEDIVDTYNIGGFFRLAEAVAAEKIYLCGKTDTPPNTRIVKASVNTFMLVPWTYKKSAADALKEIRKKEKAVMIVAVEQHRRARDYTEINYRFPLAFVFGNETSGIKPATLKKADVIAEIPMYGANKSLNAMVAAGISLYQALRAARAAKLKAKK